MLFCLDQYSTEGYSGAKGTSHTAMLFLSHWLGGFGETGRLSITSMYLKGGDVTLSRGSTLRSALNRNGVAVVRIDLDGWHYVLLTGVEEENVYVFDPYLLPKPLPIPDVKPVHDHESAYNRIVPVDRFESAALHPYAFGPYETREAVVLFNARSMKPEDFPLEYVI